MSEAAELVADVVKEVSQPSLMSPMDPLKSAADSLLPIVQSQRERFRTRAQELEAVSTGRDVQQMMNNLSLVSTIHWEILARVLFQRFWWLDKKHFSPPKGLFLLMHQCGISPE